MPEVVNTNLLHRGSTLSNGLKSLVCRKSNLRERPLVSPRFYTSFGLMLTDIGLKSTIG